MKETQNLHVFKVIYLPLTRTLPARIKITSERFQQSITIPGLSDKHEQVHEIAAAHLTELEYNVIGSGAGWGCMYIISDTFEPLHKS